MKKIKDFNTFIGEGRQYDLIRLKVNLDSDEKIFKALDLLSKNGINANSGAGNNETDISVSRGNGERARAILNKNGYETV